MNGPQVVRCMRDRPWSIEELRGRAERYEARGLEATFSFDPDHYVRKVLQRDERLEIALLCWDAGQASSIHDHRGSNCVVRVLSGCFVERLFRADSASGLYVELKARTIHPGDLTGVDGEQVHQMINVAVGGRGAMLNFYSPPFS